MARKNPGPYRCMLYNEQGSHIFTDEAEAKAALEDGWSDVPVKVAQPPKSGDEESAAQIQELNQALVKMHDDLKAAKSAQAKAEAAMADAENRANAAEAENKKLATALKKAQPDAGK